jgi:hypothetical protein
VWDHKISNGEDWAKFVPRAENFSTPVLKRIRTRSKKLGVRVFKVMFDNMASPITKYIRDLLLQDRGRCSGQAYIP